MYNSLPNFQDIGYIMLTGDYPGHDMWVQSRAKNLQHSKAMVDMVEEVFPDMPVILSMGNHESFPCNRQALKYLTA